MSLGVRPWVPIPMSQKRGRDQETLCVTSGTSQEDTKLNEIGQRLRVLLRSAEGMAAAREWRRDCRDVCPHTEGRELSGQQHVNTGTRHRVHHTDGESSQHESQVDNAVLGEAIPQVCVCQSTAAHRTLHIKLAVGCVGP